MLLGERGQVPEQHAVEDGLDHRVAADQRLAPVVGDQELLDQPA